MNDEIIPITYFHLPFSLDEKIFQCVDDEGESIGDPYSYKDCIKELKNISGVNQELLGTIEND